MLKEESYGRMKVLRYLILMGFFFFISAEIISKNEKIKKLKINAMTYAVISICYDV